MDRATETVLRAFEKRAAAESEKMEAIDMSQMQRHLDEFLLSVGPATGQLINLLAKESDAQTILEIGSSYGYSTVWLAEAARETGGKVISLELHAQKQEHARASVSDAGLGDYVCRFRSSRSVEGPLHSLFRSVLSETAAWRARCSGQHDPTGIFSRVRSSLPETHPDQAAYRFGAFGCGQRNRIESVQINCTGAVYDRPPPRKSTSWAVIDRPYS
jgi:hypothetical protein